MPPIRRKRYLVEHQLQLRLARSALVFMMAGCAFTGFAVFYATFTVLSAKLVGIYPQSRLAEIFHSLYFTLCMALLLVTPVIFYAAIVFSHRLAGPLPKMYRVLRDIGGGNFDARITLRKKDFLVELANAINAMAAQLKDREVKK
jgi:nitrate/nitrite-specific signal transduction histidine kinase